jgi:hypothetical protein
MKLLGLSSSTTLLRQAGVALWPMDQTAIHMPLKTMGWILFLVSGFEFA